MPVNIGRSLREGITRAFSRNGILLIVAWTVIGAGSLLAYNSWFAALYAGLPTEPMLIGPSLGLSPAVAGIVSVLLYLVSFVFMAGALRTFVTDERRTIPSENFTRNIVWMLGNLVVGFVLFYIALWIGFILLVVPGIFLLVSLFFWFVLVVVEDQNFFEAFRNSWTMTKGNRWSLLGVGLIVTVGGWVLMGIPMAISFALADWIGLLLFAIAASVYGVISLATSARVYVQLTSTESMAA